MGQLLYNCNYNVATNNMEELTNQLVRCSHIFLPLLSIKIVCDHWARAKHLQWQCMVNNNFGTGQGYNCGYLIMEELHVIS